MRYKYDFEMWLSLVERCVRDAEAAGSNPVISTKAKILSTNVDGIFALYYSFLSIKSSVFSSTRQDFLTED